MTAHTDPALAEVRKEVSVPQAPAEAFRLFTDGIATWWPLPTHSVGGEDATGVSIEPRVGGRILETMRGGATAVWGTITDWDPPARFACSWHPGMDPAHAGDVEVSFTATGAGTTVTLVHRGWDRRPDGRALRSNYDTGWDFVLGHYTDVTGSASPPA